MLSLKYKHHHATNSSQQTVTRLGKLNWKRANAVRKKRKSIFWI